jgi:thiamine biosynthesis lipoprotein
MDSHFKNVVIKAFEVHKATNGLFDITVGPLVEAWGFGKNKAMEADTTIIDSLLKFTGMDKIYIDKNKLFKKDERVQLNANAIAQGYSVDVICQYLDSKNIKNYMVEIGGEVRVKGKNPKNKLWKIGIDKPFDNNRTPGTNLQAILKLHNMSAATSGNYRKYIIKNGIKYVHSINPQTGYPVMHNLLSVTIITPKSITGDAYATACMVAGLEIAKKIIFNHDELEAYLIYSDKMGEFKVYKSSSMAKYLHK